MSAVGDLPAFPLPMTIQADGFGLTKRELFAAMAMQGFCSQELADVESPAFVAKQAIRIADLLIEELGR